MFDSFLQSIVWDQNRLDLMRWLDEGNVIGLPTETVYGLAAKAYHVPAIKRIYDLKKRPSHNPLIIHYPCIEAVLKDSFLSPYGQEMAEALWPGPLTMILSKRSDSKIPPEAHAFLPCIAARVPRHSIAESILKAVGPLAAPSANISGRLSPTRSQHVITSFSGLFPVVEGGACEVGLESTIIDARQTPVRILRPGSITRELLETMFPHIPFSWEKQDFTTPGSCLHHYAPHKPVRAQATSLEEGEGLVAFGPPFAQPPAFVQLSWRQDLEEAAENFFAALHTLDANPHCQKIAVMPLPSQGIGRALTDRLMRACTPPVLAS